MGITFKKSTVNLNGFILQNPVITASGTFGYCDEYEDFYEVNKLGSIVTKAISLEPRKGNQGNRIMEVEAGMINSIGLENMGINSFLDKILPKLQEKNINFILNLAGKDKSEYFKLADICENNNIKAIELNVSCPNVKSGCLEFGTDEKVLYELVNEVRNRFSKTLIVKLTPNVTSIEKMAISAQMAGADIISAINTLKAMGIALEFHDKKFNCKKISGGLSGNAIKPIALRAIKSISENTDIPIIGIGGISTLNDIFEFFAAGADAIQIGTSNFTNPSVAYNLALELEEFLIKNEFNDLEDLKHELRECVKNG